MPAFLLGAALLLGLWLPIAALVSPLYLFPGKPRRVCLWVWGVFPAFMREAASPD